MSEVFEIPPRPTAGIAVRRVDKVSNYPLDGKNSRLTDFAKPFIISFLSTFYFFMDQPTDETRWKHEYSIAAILGVAYIFLLGLFTWLFNHSL